MVVSRRFTSVNVFSKGAVDGNPVAVVLDGENLSTDEMLAFTRWTNLSEATFVLPATVGDADYRVRIFTLEREMPFAGHPTLGTAHAWLQAGGRPKRDETVVQECGAGLVPIRNDGMLSFEAPPLIRDEVPSPAELERVRSVLGLKARDVVDAHWLDNGPGWLVVMLSSADAILEVSPGSADGRFDVGLVGFHSAPAAAMIEVRALFSDHLGHIREDPVTGSLNAAVAQWLFRTNRAHGSYVAAQGQRVGRRGLVHLRNSGGAVWVGGRTTTVIEGFVNL